jgi:hypothetical protein
VNKLARVGIVLVGLWVLALVPNLLTSLSFYVTAEKIGEVSVPWLMATVLPVLASILLGLVLIVSRDRLADRLFEESDVGLAVSAVDVLRVGLALIGVSLAATAVVDATQIILSTLATLADERAAIGSGEYQSGITMANWLSSLVATAVRFALGFWLAVRSDALSKRLWSGKPSSPSIAEDDQLPRCPNCDTPYDPEDYEGGATEALCIECKQQLPLPHA